MSGFVNESHKKERKEYLEASDRGARVDERIATQNESLGAQQPEVASESRRKPVLRQVHDLHKTSSVSPLGLEGCRKAILPREPHKSLLTSQYDESLQHAIEAYRTLRTKLVKHQSQTGSRSIVISSAGQGEGKTLTAFNLALCVAKIQNWPVLLVDADLRTQGMSRLIGNPPSGGFARILETGDAYESAILQTDVPNLYVLPAGESVLSAPELFAGDTLKDFIGWSSETFKLVIIDAPPILHLADFELIEAASQGVVLVVRLGVTNQDALASTCAHVDPEKLVGLVLNDSQETADKEYYRYLTTSSAG